MVRLGHTLECQRQRSSSIEMGQGSHGLGSIVMKPCRSLNRTSNRPIIIKASLSTSTQGDDSDY